MSFPRSVFRWLYPIVAATVWILSVSTTAQAADTRTQDQAKQIWQLLDYVAIDYTYAVRDGKIIDNGEFTEMQEFAATAESQLAALPDVAAKAHLLRDVAQLKNAIAAKADPATVAGLAQSAAQSLLKAYPVPLAPTKAPDVQAGAHLYQVHCASCHGIDGRGNGPLAAKLEPPPIAFTDHARARERSVFALHQVITQGVDGTAMPGFSHLTDDDRWALAFFIGTLSTTEADRVQGAEHWARDDRVKSALPDLTAVVQSSEATLSQVVPTDVAKTTLAYVRSQPQILGAKTDTLDIAKTKLRESLAALDRGDKSMASQLALSAYLDGFEPVEPALAAKNAALMKDIETNMGLYRAAIAAGSVDEAHKHEQRLQAVLNNAQAALSKTVDDPWSIYFGALTILLREGLEALLVVVAMLAFLKKSGRSDVVPYAHGGWIAALVAGGATWMVATYLVDISGASRELTEGFAALFAAIVLLGVGIWMHQKSTADRWQAYIKETMSKALNKRSATVMIFLLSFITVYREVFETVLFYAALWSDGNGIYLLAGLLSGVVLLSGVAVALMRTSARLPIGRFFAISSMLIAILAIVLTGKGIAALQKAGLFNVTPLSLPTIDLLGIYPSIETIAAQAIIVAIVIAGFMFNARPQPKR